MMTTKKATTTLRKCIGSERFGIEPHEAPTSEFPVQPSRPDGLGTMCAVHWKAYVKGLREARMAQSPSDDVPRGTAAKESGPSGPVRRAPARASTKKERRRAPMAHTPTPKDIEIERAETLIAEVDALPGPEHVKRVGDDDVQAALETVANGAAAETPLGEAIDRGAEEADAA